MIVIFIYLNGDSMNNIYPFILPIMAGLSTLIGTLPIFIKFKNKDKIVMNSLAFAAGVMITVSLTDLLPEAFNELNNIFKIVPNILFCLIFFVIGIICSMTIDALLPENNSKNNKLYKIGIISMLAIILHNIPEGIATFMATTSNIKLGIALTLAIAFHNIPEGISISVPIYYSSNSKKKAFNYTFISAISEPFGAFLAYLFLSKYINNFILGILFAFIAGIMIHISIYELIPGSLKYHDKKQTIKYFILGCILMFTNHLLFS